MDSLSSQLGHPNAADGDIDDLGVLITTAFGLDRAWAKKGVCYKYQRAEVGPTPWQMDPGTGADRIIEMALIACSGCRAQFDCATYAVQARVQAGTWAMPIDVLRWLHKEPDRFELIESARTLGDPIARTLTAVMEAREAAPVAGEPLSA